MNLVIHSIPEARERVLNNYNQLQREPVLRKELGKVKIPVRVYAWSIRIWFPGRWVIKRTQNGETEVIPTIIVDAPTVAPLRSRPEADEVSLDISK